MYPVLTQTERAELIARYRRLPDDQAVEIFKTPQTVSNNGQAAQSFVLDEEVNFTLPDTTHVGQLRNLTGRIGLFVRRLNDLGDRTVSAVILVSSTRMYRVPLSALSKLTP